MSDLFYDKKRKLRQSKNQLLRRGLLNAGVSLEDIGIVELIADHGLDTDLYNPVGTEEVEIKEDGKAYVVYETQLKTADSAEAEQVLRDTMKSKINALRNQIYESGVPFEFSGSTYILQTRDAYDLLNWTTALSRYQALPVADLVQIRTAENVNLEMEAQQAVSLINTGVDARKAVMFAAAEIKDSIDTSEDLADAYAAYETGLNVMASSILGTIQVS